MTVFKVGLDSVGLKPLNCVAETICKKRDLLTESKIFVELFSLLEKFCVGLGTAMATISMACSL